MNKDVRHTTFLCYVERIKWAEKSGEKADNLIKLPVVYGFVIIMIVTELLSSCRIYFTEPDLLEGIAFLTTQIKNNCHMPVLI